MSIHNTIQMVKVRARSAFVYGAGLIASTGEIVEIPAHRLHLIASECYEKVAEGVRELEADAERIINRDPKATNREKR